MRLIRDIRGQQIVAFVFTGDGQTEANNLAPLCEKFDGKTKILWFPKSPLPKIKSRMSGVHALMPLRLLVIKYELDRILFIIDREHFKESSRRRSKEINEVKRFLKNKMNITIIGVKELVTGSTFIIECEVGNRNFELCLAIRGDRLHADEERARLIKLRLKSKVKPEHREITNFFRRSGIDEEDCIGRSSLNSLNKAFPSLCGALQWLEAQSV